MKKTVVYISSCAVNADGKLNPFFLQELPWLRKHFDRVVVCSGTGIAEIHEDRPDKITVQKPALGAFRALIQAPFTKLFWAEIRHLRADNKATALHMLKVLLFTIRGFKLYHWIQSAMDEGEQTTLYAYWMSYDGFAAALSKRKKPETRAIARAHAFDIDTGRNPVNPYLMKRFMVETLDTVYPISRYALNQLQSYMTLPEGRVSVIGAGSVGTAPVAPFPAPRFQDGEFHLVSCATMIEVKQIPLLIDALALWRNGKLCWTHIGGGPDAERIQAYAENTLGKHEYVSYTFTGQLAPEQVRGVYETEPFDAFINTSKSEGVPITMMEALYAGIPIIGPKIGGIPELVDETVGCLYNPDGGAEAVAAAIQTINRQTAEEAEGMRMSAQERWKECCMLVNLLPQIFPEITGEGVPQ